VRIKAQKDFWSGAMFIAIGLFAVMWSLTHYAVGTALNMGPGFMPTLVGALLTVIGAMVLFRSLHSEGPRVPAFHWRSMILIPAAAAAYGYLLAPLGLVISTILLVVVARVAGKGFSWIESLLLGIGLATFSVLVFIVGLSMPIPIWPRLIYGG
jgi:hypothetical protein